MKSVYKKAYMIGAGSAVALWCKQNRKACQRCLHNKHCANTMRNLATNPRAGGRAFMKYHQPFRTFEPPPINEPEPKPEKPNHKDCGGYAGMCGWQ